jgi:hypothetical protein
MEVFSQRSRERAREGQRDKGQRDRELAAFGPILLLLHGKAKNNCRSFAPLTPLTIKP